MHVRKSNTSLGRQSSPLSESRQIISLMFGTHHSVVKSTQRIITTSRSLHIKMSNNKTGEENIPEARLTGQMPGHIKARPGQFGNTIGSSRQQGDAALFFEKSNFAVAGASADESKFGYKRKFRSALDLENADE